MGDRKERAERGGAAERNRRERSPRHGSEGEKTKESMQLPGHGETSLDRGKAAFWHGKINLKSVRKKTLSDYGF